MRQHSFFICRLYHDDLFLFCSAEKVFAVVVLGHGFGNLAELFTIYPATLEGNLLQTGHFQTLAFLDNFNEGGSLGERVVRSCVEPGKTAL